MAKHVCVTGCTRGLGRGLAEWFLKEGWRVSGFGRNGSAIAELAGGADPQRFFRQCDVTDPEAVAAFAEELDSAFGTPDLLVNNAGLINRPAPIWKVPAEEFDRVVAVNLNGVANCLRAFLPKMIAAGKGITVNLSSGWGRSTSPEVAPYCTTKWGVEGLSQAVSQELPSGLAVAALNPGIINTDMLREVFGDSASAHDDLQEWSARAGKYLAGLGPDINGRQLTV